MDGDEDDKRQGKRLKDWREARGWSQVELGRRLDRHQVTISRWETGAMKTNWMRLWMELTTLEQLEEK